MKLQLCFSYLSYMTGGISDKDPSAWQYNKLKLRLQKFLEKNIIYFIFWTHIHTFILPSVIFYFKRSLQVIPTDCHISQRAPIIFLFWRARLAVGAGYYEHLWQSLQGMSPALNIRIFKAIDIPLILDYRLVF